MNGDEGTPEGDPPGRLIDAKIAALRDWRGETLARMRLLILRSDPEVIETVKWRKPTNPNGVPVWERFGIICTGEVYPAYVKLTFMKGASLPDPTGFSTPASTAAPDARSTSRRVMSWTRPRSPA